jgi:hypothetical protein
VQPPTKSGGNSGAGEARGGNGHSLDEADALRLEPLEWPSPRRRLVDRARHIMTGRRPRQYADDRSEPLTRVPGWLTGLACSALIIAFTQGGYLIYRISHYDTVEKLVQERIGDIYDDLRAQDQYNQLVTIYENKVQQLLIKAGIEPDDLPPVPVRPTLGKPHTRKRGGD